MAQGPRRIYVANKSFATAWKGKPPGVLLTVREGDLCFEGDPLLKSHGQFFDPADDIPETTTRAPGERRFVRLPEREHGPGPARTGAPPQGKEPGNDGSSVST